MENQSKKSIAEALVLANRIENSTLENEALGRATLEFHNQFLERNINDKIDEDENINFSGYLIETFVRNNKEIRIMNDDLRRKLVLISEDF